MDFPVSLDLAIFLTGTLTAAFVTGLAGFAFGMVAASIWLFALPPAQTTTLIVAYALLVQGYATWRLRDAIDYKRLLPFVLGSAIGIPAGVFMLEIVRPAYIRTAVGVLLIAFSVYNLTAAEISGDKELGTRRGRRRWRFQRCTWRLDRAGSYPAGDLDNAARVDA